MKDTEGKNIELFYLPDLLDMITSSRGTLEVGGIPIFRLKAMAFSGWQGFWKRAFDIVVSFLGLILLSPFLLLVALLIKISSRGPVFYQQERVGLDGQEFKIVKFRTMMVMRTNS